MPTLRSLGWVLPLLLLISFAGCKKRRTVAITPTNMKQLEGTWLLSQEENTGDTLVYRPNTYAFPPARGRTGFAIKPYGRFEQFDIAPTDGLDGRPGTWTIDRKTKLRIHLTDELDPNYTLEILEIDSINKVLKVRRLAAPG